jgi:ADP-ribose pyrophosphatase YjhB (NUDIX family)
MSDHADSIAWLDLAQRLQAICQTGLQLTKGHYDRINYGQLMELAAEIVARHTELEKAEMLRSFLAQPSYATVKVDVRGALIHEGRLLLVQERMDMRWTLPGGWADVGETPSEMVAREVLEESGIVVRPSRIVGVYDANRKGRPMEFYHAYKIVFLCDYVSGAPRPSDETAAAAFFDFDELPELSFPRTEQRHIDDLRAALADPCAQPRFD